MTVEECERYIEEGHFAPGSMLPKIKSALTFAKNKPGKKAIITSLFKAVDALRGNTGTVVSTLSADELKSNLHKEVSAK